MSKLSSAFLQPKTPMHLQFAYYEASLAVEFWIARYGMQNMLRLLEDLSVGMPAEEALKRAPGSLELLDQDFTEYALALANNYGKGVNFKKPTAIEIKDGAWLNENPDSYWACFLECKDRIDRKKWNEALGFAETLKRMDPEDGGNDGVYGMLATIHRGFDNEANERDALISLVDRSADSSQSLMRLIELDSRKQNWDQAAKWCERMIEIDPLRIDVQQSRAVANEKLDKQAIVVSALEAILEMAPADPANVHFRLAVAKNKLNLPNQVKRHLLMALEESPRYTDALKMLASISKTNNTPTTDESR